MKEPRSIEESMFEARRILQADAHAWEEACAVVCEAYFAVRSKLDQRDGGHDPKVAAMLAVAMVEQNNRINDIRDGKMDAC